MTAHLAPSFFIIGERKCGTSSLYRYLLEHPQVLPGRRKEMQFFTRGRAHVEAHFDDYLANFPEVDGAGEVVLDWPELDANGTLFEERIGFDRDPSQRYVSGEASADTFFDADPTLLKEFLPNLSLLLLLRDPAQRAFSHHRMYRRFQEEGRALPFAVGDFATDMRREMERVAQGETTPCISPSLYVENLERWKAVWGPRLQVLFTAELDVAEEFSAVMGRVLSHLGLPAHVYSLEERYNQAPRARMPTKIQQELRDFFAPHDNALQARLGRSVPW